MMSSLREGSISSPRSINCKTVAFKTCFMSEEIRELNQKVSSLVAELESADFDSRLEKEEAHRILQRLEERLHSFEAEHLEDVLIQG